MYKVWMLFDEGDFAYGVYESRNKANEVGAMLRAERGCDIWIEEI